MGIPRHTTDMQEAIQDTNTDVVIVALRIIFMKAVIAAAGLVKRSVRKPLGPNAGGTGCFRRSNKAVSLLVLGSLCYTPKTLKAIQAVGVARRPSPLGSFMRNLRPSSGGSGTGSIPAAEPSSTGYHCIEIARNFIGKTVRPVEVMLGILRCINQAEDHAIGLVKYENGAIGQFEASWAFRGGMDLRDEICGTGGMIWLNHWLRTGMEMHTSGGIRICRRNRRRFGLAVSGRGRGIRLGVHRYVYRHVQLHGAGAHPQNFYDGYIVNAIIDAAYAIDSNAGVGDGDLERPTGVRCQRPGARF